MTMPITLEDAESQLRSVRTSFLTRDDAELANVLQVVKADAVRRGDHELSKQLWCLETTLQVQSHFVRAFAHCKLAEYYAGWCAFERAEVGLIHLKRHFAENWPLYALDFIAEHTQRFQSLFPYRLFTSPGFLVKERRCSVCNSLLSLRQRCPHKKGEVYNGEMCWHVISKFELLEISMVTDPVQKYSVAFKSDDAGGMRDHYNYAQVEFVVERLASPFHLWKATETYRFEPHGKFPGLGRNSRCPCGSGKKYKACCLPCEGIRFPHVQIDFQVPPVDQSESFVLLGSRLVPGKLKRDPEDGRFWTEFAPCPGSVNEAQNPTSVPKKEASDD
jgi:hypothetical protein